MVGPQNDIAPGISQGEDVEAEFFPPLDEEFLQLPEPSRFDVIGNRSPRSRQLDDVANAIQRFVIRQPGRAQVVFHLVMGLVDHCIGDELRPD